MSPIDQDIQESAAATRIQMQEMQDPTDRSARVYEKSYRLEEPGSCGLYKNPNLDLCAFGPAGGRQ